MQQPRSSRLPKYVKAPLVVRPSSSPSSLPAATGGSHAGGGSNRDKEVVGKDVDPPPSYMGVPENGRAGK